VNVQKIYRVEVEFMPSEALVYSLSDNELLEALDGLLTALHGLAKHSVHCESFNGNPAFNPRCSAEFLLRPDAAAVEFHWRKEITQRGYVIVGGP
jgi:hypothetical protein